MAVGCLNGPCKTVCSFSLRWHLSYPIFIRTTKQTGNGCCEKRFGQLVNVSVLVSDIFHIPKEETKQPGNSLNGCCEKVLVQFCKVGIVNTFFISICLRIKNE